MLSPNRIFGFDVLRTIAILLVVLSHALRFASVSPETHHTLELFMGFMGVELFFALSGFLIGGILLRENETGISAKSVGKFWVRRWMRTLPAYYVVLFGTLLLYTLLYGESNISFSYILPYIFFVQNFTHPHPEYFGVAWSLSIEEWFYLVFPLVLGLIALVTRAAKSRFFIVIFIFLLAGILMRFVHTAGTTWDSDFRKIVVFRPDAIVFGLLMAWLKKYSPILFAKKLPFAFTGIILLIISTVLFYRCGAQENKINFLTGQLLLPLTGIGFACLLPFASEWKSCKFIIPGKIIVFISLISYSLYLIHSTVWEIYLTRFNEVKQGFSQWLIFAGYLAISIVAATILYYCVEKPFMKWRDKLTRG
jgi:peptidoglycan/LPS O-acetylase OafA/YrhL